MDWKGVGKMTLRDANRVTSETHSTGEKVWRGMLEN